MYAWVMALHIVFMVTWFAGLFYLPRLYVYHAMPENQDSFKLFDVMERRLFIMMTIGMTLTLILGVVMLFMGQGALFQSGWFQVKLALLVLLFGYHHACYKLMIKFRTGLNKRSHKWYRMFNEVPSLLLILIVILAVIKPFA